MEKVFEQNELISVVVPVYKVENYLKKCVDSILCQTYDNLEIILVDDGSPDSCPKMCDDYMLIDKRIKAIHKNNGGLSDARNAGIEIATGRYITFVDSDDFLYVNAIEVLYDNIKKYNSDISIGGHKVIYSDGKIINRFNNKEYCIGPEETLRKILYDDGIDLSAWAKLYKLELFNKIKYPVGRLYEDSATTYKLVDSSNKISVISVPVYEYVIRNDSITNYNFSRKKMDLILSTQEMTEYVIKRYPNLKKACNRRLMYAYLSTITQLAKSSVVDKKIKNELIDFISKNRWGVLFDKRAPLRDKLGILSLFCGFGFYKKMWELYDRNRGE